MQEQAPIIQNVDLEPGEEAPEAPGLNPIEGAQLVASFMDDLEKNRFVLTSLPEIALRVRQVLDNPRVTATEIASVVSTDPAIAAKIIRVSNSPLYRSWEPCATLRDALVRLGLDTTRELVMSYTVKDLFTVDIEPIRKFMRDAWRHILYHGAIAWVMARETGRFSPEEAMTAALMSNIGTLALSHYLENHPEIYEDPGKLDAVAEYLKAKVGVLVLEEWGLSGQMVECARHSDNWEREHCGDPDLCDLIIVAKLHSYISLRKVPPIHTVPAYQRLADARLIDTANSLSFLEQASDQVAEARAVLDF